MEKVSIIIPVYNVEKYLEECVQSVQNQTHENLEIILVDDGSSDRSGKICDSLANNDERILVFHTKNQGVSAARNHGLSHASGKYVAFVDSDDLVESDYIEKLYGEIEKDETVGLVVCDYKMKTDDNFFEVAPKNKKTKYCVKDEKDFFNLYEYSLTPSVWAKLFIKEKITDGFDENLNYGEDDLFILDYLKNIDNIVFVNKPLYVYRNDSRETLTTKAYKNLLEIFEKLQPKREEAISKICDSNLAYSALAMSNIRQSTIMLEQQIRAYNKYSTFKNLFKSFKKDAYFKRMLKTSRARNFKEKVILILYKLNLRKLMHIALKRK